MASTDHRVRELLAAWWLTLVVMCSVGLDKVYFRTRLPSTGGKVGLAVTNY